MNVLKVASVLGDQYSLVIHVYLLLAAETKLVQLEWSTGNVDHCVPTHVTASLAGTPVSH